MGVRKNPDTGEIIEEPTRRFEDSRAREPDTTRRKRSRPDNRRRYGLRSSDGTLLREAARKDEPCSGGAHRPAPPRSPPGSRYAGRKRRR